MYQIDICSLKSMLEATTAFRTSIENLTARMEQHLTAMEACWSGTVKDRAEETGRTLLDIHCANAITRLNTIEKTLTEVLRQAVLLKDRMRKLEEVVRGEEPAYGEEILEDETQYQGIIGFDETLCEQVKTSCTAAAEWAMKHEELINGIVGDLEGIVDLSDEQAALVADCKRVENLE